ncbi:GntR family transcriptional regulator [Sodalis-like endosymbiont of Proechinophthirus fluctus]
MILTGQLVPGHNLNISEIAQRFSISLNMVRKALSQLAGVLG